MITKKYTEYAVKKTCELLAIDSPSGYTKEAAEWLKKEFEDMGYKAEILTRGGVTVDLGGKESDQGAIMLMAHADTLGGIVKEILPNGRLRIINVGGARFENIETENVRIYTKFSGVYEGTVQLKNASTHVNRKYNEIKRDTDNMEVVIDEDTTCIEDTERLGIQAGDYVCFDPRTRVTKSGYIKSRFLDDKLSCGILLAYAKYLKDSKTQPSRRVYLHFTTYEETGGAGASFCPADVTDAISVDMGCVGDTLTCTERTVDICALDGGGPYSYDLVKGLEIAAIEAKVDYTVNVYWNYSSDAQVLVKSGANVRNACMGAGVYASHSYERSHKDGVWNTLRLMAAFIK